MALRQGEEALWNLMAYFLEELGQHSPSSLDTFHMEQAEGIELDRREYFFKKIIACFNHRKLEATFLSFVISPAISLQYLLILDIMGRTIPAVN